MVKYSLRLASVTVCLSKLAQLHLTANASKQQLESRVAHLHCMMSQLGMNQFLQYVNCFARAAIPIMPNLLTFVTAFYIY